MPTRNTPPGGDMRYNYVPFARLNTNDRLRITGFGGPYPHGKEYLPDQEYLYPVRKDGRLASARRWISCERAAELLREHTVREIMER